MKNLASYAAQNARCSRCGACAVNCPVYKVSQEETYLARGRMHLAEAVQTKKIPLSSETEKRLNACLLCGACTDSCPTSVPCDEIILSARVEAVKRRGLPLLKALTFKHVIQSKWRFEIGRAHV